MKLGMLVRFAIDNIVRKAKVFLAVVLLTTFSLLLIGCTAYFNDVTIYGKKVVNQLLTIGIDRTGVLSINDEFNDDKAIKFQKEAYASEQIEFIGSYGYRGNDNSCFEVLLRIQEKEGTVTGDYKNELEVGVVDDTATSMCHWPLAEGVMPQEVEYKDGPNGMGAIYLGSNFSNIPIGTVYELKYPDGGAYTYVVKGRFKKNTYGLDDSMIYQHDTMALNYRVPWDNMVVMVTSGGAGGDMWIYGPADGYTLQDADMKLKELAKKYNKDVTFTTLSKSFEEKERENQDVIDYTLQLFVFVSVTTFVVMSCIQLAGIYSRKSEYGIFYANGASTRDLLLILLMENTVKVIIGGFFAMIGCALCLVYFYARFNQYMLDVALDILSHTTIWKMAVAMLVLIGIASVLPMVVLRKFKPVELIGGNDT